MLFFTFLIVYLSHLNLCYFMVESDLLVIFFRTVLYLISLLVNVSYKFPSYIWCKIQRVSGCLSGLFSLQHYAPYNKKTHYSGRTLFLFIYLCCLSAILYLLVEKMFWTSWVRLRCLFVALFLLRKLHRKITSSTSSIDSATSFVSVKVDVSWIVCFLSIFNPIWCTYLARLWILFCKFFWPLL